MAQAISFTARGGLCGAGASRARSLARGRDAAPAMCWRASQPEEVSGSGRPCYTISLRRSTMNKGEQKTISAREFIAATVFYLIIVLLFPLTAIGYMIWICKGILAGLRPGGSR